MSSGDDDDEGQSGDRRYGYWPVGGPSLAGLLLVALAALLLINLATYAYQRIGISTGWFDAILIGSIIGSRINIPIWRFHTASQAQAVDVVFMGVRYRIPAARQMNRSILAVNVGGAIIPTAVSVYLITHDRIWAHALIAIACVAAVVWLVARPVQGVGIVAPTFVPPAAAAVAAIVIGRPSEAALAYICGTLGTLIGADLINLPRIRRMGAPEASIGGAGTFDGVFLSGLIAVLLATL